MIPSSSDTQHLQNTAAESDRDPLSTVKDYHRIVLLTDGFSTPFFAKTAVSLLRYRCQDVLAILDSNARGTTASTLFDVGGDIPVIASLDQVDADALFLGIAPPGGALPEPWHSVIADALSRGMDVVSGLHDFLSDNSEFATIARRHGRRLIDVRKNCHRQTAQCIDFRDNCLRIHAVGQDCSVGKMVATLEVQRNLVERGQDAEFLATGQTGIMIAGRGVPIDCVVADFVNGAAESLVQQHDQHDILLIEGQGSISHPSFSAVTLGLLHGCAPDGLIFCYEVGRTMVKGLAEIPLLPLRTLIDAYEANASLRHPCRVIGIAMNSRRVGPQEAAAERERVSREFDLPVCDVYRDGADPLADAVLQLKQELQK